MERIDARPSRPLHPTLLSRFPAPSSREQLSNPLSFSTLLDVTSVQLERSVRVIPPTRKAPGIFGFGLHVAGIASDNGIREDDFREHFPRLALRRLKGEEAHTGDPLIDARSKALSAAEIQRSERIHHPFRTRLQEKQWWKANPIIGLDAVNAIPIITTDGNIDFERLGKPERIAQGQEMQAVQELFGYLSKTAKENNWPSIPYIIEMATYVHNSTKRHTNRDAYSVRQMVVMLDPEKLAYLATPIGFARYQEIAATSYPTLSKTAAGMKVETFHELGVIQYITENPEELALGKWTQTDQEKAYFKANVLAKGLSHLSLLEDYIQTIPPTIGQRLRRRSARS